MSPHFSTDPDLSHKDPRRRLLKEAVAVKTPRTRGDPTPPTSPPPLLSPTSHQRGSPPQTSAALPSSLNMMSLPCARQHTRRVLRCPCALCTPPVLGQLTHLVVLIFICFIFIYVFVYAHARNHKGALVGRRSQGTANLPPSGSWEPSAGPIPAPSEASPAEEELQRDHPGGCTPSPCVPNTDECQLMRHKGTSCCHRVQKSGLAAAISLPLPRAARASCGVSHTHPWCCRAGEGHGALEKERHLPIRGYDGWPGRTSGRAGKEYA